MANILVELAQKELLKAVEINAKAMEAINNATALLGGLDSDLDPDEYLTVLKGIRKSIGRRLISDMEMES